jgi:hypothetical protein
VVCDPHFTYILIRMKSGRTQSKSRQGNPPPNTILKWLLVFARSRFKSIAFGVNFVDSHCTKHMTVLVCSVMIVFPTFNIVLSWCELVAGFLGSTICFLIFLSIDQKEFRNDQNEAGKALGRVVTVYYRSQLRLSKTA